MVGVGGCAGMCVEVGKHGCGGAGEKWGEPWWGEYDELEDAAK